MSIMDLLSAYLIGLGTLLLLVGAVLRSGNIPSPTITQLVSTLVVLVLWPITLPYFNIKAGKRHHHE